MFQAKVIMNNIADVTKFTKVATQCMGNVMIESENRYVVDGKSLLGILSLDLSKPVTVHVKTQEEIDTINTELADLLVKQVIVMEITFDKLQSLYHSNKEFQTYVDRYCTNRKIALEVALNHSLVMSVAEQYLRNTK